MSPIAVDPPYPADRVACPRCGAPPGQPCAYRGRYPGRRAHLARQDKATRLWWGRVDEEIRLHDERWDAATRRLGVSDSGRVSQDLWGLL
ncbi:zinc finger domain-containing protein [Nostocoides japonicum]